jgi:nicotinate-nucleotide pyrophosphorylase (carboxylating)
MTFDTYIDEFIDLAFREDIGDGDHTSLSTIPHTAIGKMKLLVKQEGILSGSKIAELIFKKLDPSADISTFISDGIQVKPGDIAFIIHGKVTALLQAERLVLNIMQRMSGIATQTNIYVKKLEGLQTKILDTRKTTPGMRLLDKIAVKTGGGVNHRIGLFDMILIKDNHIDFAGGIEKAIQRAQQYLAENKKDLKIEVESRSMDDVKKILLTGGVHRIMLDNFSIEETKRAVDFIQNRVETESSGGITLKNIRDYAECGVDYISIGALTHQIKSLDLSLKAIDF